MALLGNYDFKTVTEDEFDFSFEIPDNCNYTTEYDADKNINTISITLNSGQSQPSGTYNTEYLTFNATDGLLDLQIQQTLNGVTSTKPRITVYNTF